jgi:hypothetical protein
MARKNCDRCPAEAKHTVRLPSGRTLDFCLHHFRQHKEALAQAHAREQ